MTKDEDHINLQPLSYYERELERALAFVEKKENKYKKLGVLLYSEHMVLCHHKQYIELLRDRIRYIKSKEEEL